MNPVLRMLLGLVLVLVFGALALVSLAFGVTLDGKGDPAVQCTLSAPRPEVGGPYFESTITTGERTWFPLGVNCTYDSPDDEVGPQTVVNSNWTATGVCLASSILTLVGMKLLLRPAPPTKRVGMRPRGL
ncbi:hypothetical protein [Leifsonia sp. Leaf264]|uniref:hypothetical protein n=1 Tax=Leifsonia sp. Leaf264 TaxID=1736314 RepID=UPI0006FDBBF7|nr:hypothetical protein [Leifsonia sp. Leaf264]KQP01848.1 hypothetical protein ASF30_04610 [Leifsonia sp. Leaf264]